MRRKLPEPGRGRGAVHLIGGGPSLDPRILKGKKYLCAINQAHDHLLENNVTPHWCTLVDPVPWLADQITPHGKVTYFVASQCDPKLFDKLAGCDVRIFHVQNSVPIDDLVGSPLRVQGGTSTILRAWCLHWMRGHHVFHFWGFDCCGDHAYAHKSHLDMVKLKFTEAGKEFVTEKGLLRQARGFFQQLDEMKRIRPPTVHVHGDGLVSTLMRHHGL